MARDATILRILIACPEDVAEEGTILENIIHELNNTWSKRLGILLELVSWKTHAYPGVGEDAQAIINEQLENDYDIFIGIMWMRFGTPTGRAGSGTAEEFNRAYEKYCENRDQVRIMFYFNESAPSTPLSSLNLDQLILIKEFRERLGEKGTLYWPYKDREEFAALIRMHLSRQVQEWKKSWGRDDDIDSSAIQKATPEITVLENTDNIQQDEEGFLDLIERGQESFETLNEVTSHMTAALESIGKKTHNRTAEMNEANKSGNIKLVKRAANGAAEDLEQYATLMEAEIPIFAKSYTEGIDAFVRAAGLWSEFANIHNQDLKTEYSQVQSLKFTLGESRDTLIGFRESIASLPRFTTAFNRAKKHAVSVMDDLTGEMATAINLTTEVEKEFKRIIESSNGDKSIPEHTETSEAKWLHAAAGSPAFDFLSEPEEDIYTLADGKPFHD